VPSPPRMIRVVPGEIDARQLTTRLVLPTTAQPAWPPFRRVSESIANRERHLPAHAHEGEEVLTYVTEGVAAYQVDAGSAELVPSGGARLLIAPSRVGHRVSPGPGGTVRWFNLVVALPPGTAGAPRKLALPESPTPREEDNVSVRSLVGPGAPMASLGGLECDELSFSEESTTFRKVGRERRAVVYALSGRGAVDQQPIEAGEAAFVEGVPGTAVRGTPGFRTVLATAPR